MNRVKRLLIAIAVVYALAAFVDPCDGHSCDAEITQTR